MNNILTKVYGTSSMAIAPVVLLICFVCKWPLLMIALAMMATIVLSCPATIALQILVWLFPKTAIEKGFAWMLLMAFIPPFAFIAAWLFADFVPGKIWFLLLLGTFSGYVGILSHGIPVTQFFNSVQHEREKHDTDN